MFWFLTGSAGRNLIKLFAERRLGVSGSGPNSHSRSRAPAFLPAGHIYVLFRVRLDKGTIDKWFSRPVGRVAWTRRRRHRWTHASQSAHAAGLSIASQPSTQHAFAGHGFSAVVDEFRIAVDQCKCEAALQGRFMLAGQLVYHGGKAVAGEGVLG